MPDFIGAVKHCDFNPEHRLLGDGYFWSLTKEISSLTRTSETFLSIPILQKRKSKKTKASNKLPSHWIEP